MRVMRVANLSNVDWNLFLVLHTVLEEGSATRAAKRLSVTQSAVSNALARLRLVLDDPLVVRVGNQLVPTATARALAPRLRVAVAELTEALSPPRAFDAATSTRRFVIAASDDVELWLLRPLSRRLERDMPASSLRVVSLDTAHAANALGTGEIDAIVGVVESVPAGCAAEELCEDEVAFVVRRDHPLARGRVPLERLADHPRVTVDSSLDVKRALDAALAPIAQHRTARLHVASFTAAASALTESDAILALPRRAATALATSLDVRALRLSGEAAPLSVSLVWHARSDADLGSARLRELVRSAAAAAEAPSSPAKGRRSKRRA